MKTKHMASYRKNVEIFKFILWLQIALLKIMLIFSGFVLLDLGL